MKAEKLRGREGGKREKQAPDEVKREGGRYVYEEGKAKETFENEKGGKDERQRG